LQKFGCDDWDNKPLVPQVHCWGYHDNIGINKTYPTFKDGKKNLLKKLEELLDIPKNLALLVSQICE
jgi:hypothetical protein